MEIIKNDAQLGDEIKFKISLSSYKRKYDQIKWNREAIMKLCYAYWIFFIGSLLVSFNISILDVFQPCAAHVFVRIFRCAALLGAISNLLLQRTSICSVANASDFLLYGKAYGKYASYYNSNLQDHVEKFKLEAEEWGRKHEQHQNNIKKYDMYNRIYERITISLLCVCVCMIFLIIVLK